MSLPRLLPDHAPGGISAQPVSHVTLNVAGSAIQLRYKGVVDWFAYLESLTKLGCPTNEEVEKLAEIKASRDILVHSNGVANATYVRKAGSRARCRDGERLEVPEDYHRDSWQTIKRVIRDISDAATRKA
jgi:hypothetical protein